MARNYKRDSRGKFARVGSAVGRAAANHASKQRKRQVYRIAKANNRTMSKKAVSMGLLTKQQGTIARKRANTRAKMEMKGYKVSNEYTYKGDSRGRKRADGRYEYKRTEYRKG